MAFLYTAQGSFHVLRQKTIKLLTQSAEKLDLCGEMDTRSSFYPSAHATELLKYEIFSKKALGGVKQKCILSQFFQL